MPQVQWVRQRISHIPIRFMFESALELMSETKVGNFEMKGSGGKAAGPPAPIKVRSASNKVGSILIIDSPSAFTF